MRRGLKAEANAIAREVRQEIGLRLTDPLDPWRLAKHLEIPVLRLSEFQDVVPACVHPFASSAPSDFSAVTVFSGTERLIIHNDAHTPGRQASNVAHELSHALLLHPPAPALDHRGCRHWNSEMEDEANWLAGALLILEEAALAIVRRGLSLDDAADHYGVSVEMVPEILGSYLRGTRWARRDLLEHQRDELLLVRDGEGSVETPLEADCGSRFAAKPSAADGSGKGARKYLEVIRQRA